MLLGRSLAQASAQEQPSQPVEVMRVPQEMLDDLRRQAGEFQQASATALARLQADRNALASIQQEFVG